MAIDFDVFGAFVENLIGCNLDGRLIITVHGCRLCVRDTNIL